MNDKVQVTRVAVIKGSNMSCDRCKSITGYIEVYEIPDKGSPIELKLWKDCIKFMKSREPASKRGGEE